MTIDPRHIPCQKAENELLSFLADLEQRYKLTEAEYLLLLNRAIAGRLIYVVRSERDK